MAEGDVAILVASIAAVAAIVAALIAAAVTFGLHAWQERQSRRSLRAAISAEIGTILDQAEIRNHNAMYRQYVDRLRQGGSVTPVPYVLGAENLGQSTAVFGANLARVGDLGPSNAGDVVRFYSMIQGIDVDLRAAGLGQLDDWTSDKVIHLVEEDLAIWERAAVLGQDLIRRLQ